MRIRDWSSDVCSSDVLDERIFAVAEWHRAAIDALDGLPRPRLGERQSQFCAALADDAAQLALMESGQQVGPQSDSLPLPHGQLLLDQPLPAQITRLADPGAITAPGRDRICVGHIPLEPGTTALADQPRH